MIPLDRTNIEFKARCLDLQAAEEAFLAFGAEFKADLHQLDTYFNVTTGRLKLREINHAPAELIYYRRANDVNARRSDYSLSAVADATSLKQLLTAAMGIRRIVQKHRRLLLWRQIRIHLDEVHALGAFLEFEAVVSQAYSATDGEAGIRQLASVASEWIGERIESSYGDL